MTTAAVDQPGRRRFAAALSIVVTTLALVAAEAVARVIDGYRLTSLRLISTQTEPAPARSGGAQKFDGDTDAWFYAQQLPAATGVDRSWFNLTLPPRPAIVPDRDLRERAERYGSDSALHANYEWNINYVRQAVCAADAETRAVFQPFGEVFAFDPGSGTEWPTYRFLRAAIYPDGLRTNRFGWRSPDIDLKKPPRTIRIAFVGASTTVGAHALRYSYPELVGIWLNRWAAERHRDIAFEVMNAGREGINSRSIQAVVVQEVVPAEPDFVVYYEGSNQFWPGDFLGPVNLPPRPRSSGPQPSAWAKYSAVGRRIDWMTRRAVQPGSEPAKPRFIVHWPSDLDENNPNLSHPQLPINLNQILRDLDTIRRSVDADGGRLVMTSFMWLVYPGLVLDPARDGFLFDFLNRNYWPFSYAHLRRLLDFQARVFRKYAETHRLDFIDYAAEFPRDPRLFSDAVHMTTGGIQLQAWIMFNGLVPIVERQIASHQLPRGSRGAATVHPAFGPRRLFDLQPMRAACQSMRKP
jgi:hypothetical protein